MPAVPHVLLVPDHRGEGTRSGLLDRVGAAGAAGLVVVLNGPDPAELAAAEALLPAGVAVRSPEGLDAALRAGYRAVVDRYPGCRVVRADTAEHPFGDALRLSEHLDGGADLVVGDLSFGPSTLRDGSADAYHNTAVLPHLFEVFTGGRLSLSGAHGYQAASPELLREALPLVERLLAGASLRAGRHLSWGWDSAMVLAALQLGVRFEVVPVAATVLRDRPQAKAEAQLADLLPLLLEWHAALSSRTHLPSQRPSPGVRSGR